MNNYSERLNAKVRAHNKVNARANELHPELLEVFRPFVGKKVLVNGNGLVAKLRPQIEALRERESQPGRGRFQLWLDSSTYHLSFTLKAWESYQGEQYGGSYAEATINVGELGRNGATHGDHCDVPRDHLATLNEVPLALRTDYNAEEVRALRIAAEAAEAKAREFVSALYPFGKYDN
jgi:hypothetical protein